MVIKRRLSYSITEQRYSEFFQQSYSNALQQKANTFDLLLIDDGKVRALYFHNNATGNITINHIVKNLINVF